MEKKLYQTPIGRLSYPHVFTPQEEVNPRGDYEGYSCSIFVDPEDERAKEIQQAVVAIAKEKWPNIPFADIKPNITCLQREELDGQEMLVIKAKRKTDFGPPRVVNLEGKTLTEESEIYGGVWGAMMVSPYTWERLGKIGVSLGLKAVCKIRDGEPFGDSAAFEFDDTALSNEVSSAVQDDDIPF